MTSEESISEFLLDCRRKLEKGLENKFNQLTNEIYQKLDSEITYILRKVNKPSEYEDSLRNENSKLKKEFLEMNDQLNQYKLIVSDLNSKITALEDEKKSLITVIKILQEDNEQKNKQNWNVVNNRKNNPEQIKMQHATCNTQNNSKVTVCTKNRFDVLISDSESEENIPMPERKNHNDSKPSLPDRCTQGIVSNCCPNDDQSNVPCDTEVIASESRCPHQQGKKCNAQEMSSDEIQVNNDHRSGSQNGKQNTKQEQGKKVLLIGDSIIKEIEVNKLSSTKLVQKICMPGAKSEEIKNRLQSTLKSEAYDQVLIHAGTNDLSTLQTRQVVDQIIDVAESAITWKPNMNICISGLTVTRDTDKNTAVLSINDTLKTICQSKGWTFINNSRIGTEHLKCNSIHLNKVGIKLLASNFIRQALRSSDKSKGKSSGNFPKSLWNLAKALNRIAQLP